MDGTLAIVGTGRMGEALLRGLLTSDWIGPDRVVCTDSREDRLEELHSAHGVRTTTDNAAAIADAEVVLLALKPQILPAVLRSVGDAFRPGQTVISVTAGITTSAIEAAIPTQVGVVRVMPNTPGLVDEGMSVVVGGTHATDEDLALAETVLGHVGEVLRLDEGQLDAVTAVSGSGPAYLFLVAEAMIEAGVQLGLARDVATTLTVQTMLGSATLLRDGGMHPVELREMVTSPGGTTAVALRELERSGVRAAFADAMEACKLRAEELGRDG